MSLLLEAAAVATVMTVAGAHVLTPLRLPRASSQAREAWGLAALPALLVAVIAGAVGLGARPDAALAAGLTSWTEGSTAFRLLVVLLPALAAVDLVAAVGRRKMETAAWWIAGTFGGLALVAVSLVLEELRLGAGLGQPAVTLALATLCRLAVAVGFAELLAPGRPRWTPVAAVALLAYPFLLPVGVRAAIQPEEAAPSLLAAAALLTLARWAPERLRRPAVGGGILVGSLALARFTQLSHELALEPMGSTPPLPIP